MKNANPSSIKPPYEASIENCTFNASVGDPIKLIEGKFSPLIGVNIASFPNPIVEVEGCVYQELTHFEPEESNSPLNGDTLLGETNLKTKIISHRDAALADTNLMKTSFKK